MRGGGGPTSAAPPAGCDVQRAGRWADRLAAAARRGVTGRRAVADGAAWRGRASLLFGVWALVHVAVFSTQQGIFHPYYVSALAPAVAALAGMGLVAMWRFARESWAGTALLAATIAGTAWLAVDLLARTADFAPWLRVAIRVAAGVAVLGTVALRTGAPRAALAVLAVTGAFALFAGPASYAVANLGHSLNGNNVLAGPSGVARAASAAARAVAAVRGGQPPSGARAATPRAAPARPAARPRAAAGFGGRASISSDMLAYLEAHRAARSSSSPRTVRRRPRRSSSRPARRSSRSAASAARTTRRPSPSSRRWCQSAS